MTKKEYEKVRESDTAILHTVKVHDMITAGNIAEENGGGKLNYLMAGYILGYERATRQTKNQQKKKQHRA